MTQISRILNGLQPNANYTVQVRSKNSDGQYSDWSNTYSFNTPSTALVVNQNSVQQILSGNGLIQTGSADPRVVISSKGIAATNNSGGYTFVLDAVLGAASFTGNITAQSGTIGGMNIIGASLTSGAGTSAMGISGNGQYSFWAGNVDPVAAPFSVQRDGTIKATGLTATNSVVVGTGPSGSYAGLTPNATRAIWSGATSSAGDGANFYVTNTGSVFANAASFSGPILSGTSTNSGSIIGGALIVPTAANPLFSVNPTGYLTSSSGNIAGWNVIPNALYSSYGSGSFAAMSPGTLSGASANYVFWAGNSNPASAPFSVKADGTVVATGIIATASLVVGQSGGKYTGIIPANNLAIFGGASDNIGTGATFSVTNSGSLYATIGTIGGWNITPNELYIGSGTQKLALNTSASPKIYVGNGVFSDAGTGFFVDNKGNFSLGNQLTFVPSQGSASTVKTTANVSFGSNTITPVYDNSSQVIINGTLVTGSALPTGTYVTNVTYGVNPTITLNNNATATDASSSVTFQPDNLSLLNVVGRIRGIVDSVSPISAPTLYATITSASINTTASVISFTTNGHFFSASSILILENLPATNGLSKFNYAASVGNAYVIASVPNSINFTINTGSVTGLTSGNITSLSGKASIQQLTMGLHVAENPGTSYAHQAGTGVRLDEYNWWFTNNQFRVGNPLSYMQYTATGLQITGGDTYSTIFKVGPTAANNIIAIYSPKTTVTTTLSGSTINYVDTYFNSYTASGTTISTVANNPTFSSSTTPFYVDGSGQFSLGNKFQWSGSAGTLILGDQTGGTVGFQAPSNPTPTSIALYAGTGAANSSTAPFRVNYQGDVFASSASITGNITASAGSIGNWTVNSNSLTSANVGMYAPTSPASNEIAFFAGSAVANRSSAPFRVDYSGNVTVNNLSASGTINGLTVGFGSGNISSNTVLGSNAFLSNTTGTDNFAAGASALYSNTIGNYNVAIGNNALKINTIGPANIAIGQNVLSSITDGIANIGIGQNSMQYYTSGNSALQSSLGLGFNTLNNGTAGVGSGVSNIALGANAMSYVASGSTSNFGYYNITIGNSAYQAPSGVFNSAGQANIVIGYQAAGNSNPKTGNYNYFSGYRSGYQWINGNNNLAIGYQSMYSIISGSNNIALGYQSMGIQAGNISGNNNVALGSNSMYNITSGSSNIAMGTNAAYSLTTAIENIVIGTNAGAKIVGTGILKNSYNVIMGYNALSGASAAETNVLIGNQVLSSSSLNYAIDNVAVGRLALANVTGSAISNTAVGVFALNNISASSTGNTAVGYRAAGAFFNSGNYNTLLGYSTDIDIVPNISGAIAIGTDSTGLGAVALVSNQIVIGTLNHTKNITIAGNTVNVGAWVTYSPSIVMGTSGTFAIGNGSMFFYYCQIGKTVHFRGQITTGTTTTFGVGYIGISFPVPISSNLIANFPIGITQWRQNAGTTWAGNIVVNSVGNNNFVLRAPQTGSSASGQITTWTNAAPLGQATGDTWSWQGTYESA